MQPSALGGWVLKDDAVRKIECLQARIDELEDQLRRLSGKAQPADCPWCGANTEIVADTPSIYVQCENAGCGACGPRKVTDVAAVLAWDEIAGGAR